MPWACLARPPMRIGNLPVLGSRCISADLHLDATPGTRFGAMLALRSKSEISFVSQKCLRAADFSGRSAAHLRIESVGGVRARMASEEKCPRFDNRRLWDLLATFVERAATKRNA